MLIKSFSARKVHEYYDFNFVFNEDVTFLVGINGSGKTTALKLMQAAISLDVQTLIMTSFSSLKIEIEGIRGLINLIITKKSSSFTVSMNNRDFILEIPPFLNDEQLKMSNQAEESTEKLRYELLKNGGETFGYLLNNHKPLFLGLDRSSNRYDEEIYSIDFHYPHPRALLSKTKEKIEGIENCFRLIESAYKKYRRASDGNFDRILNIILESTFEYIDITEESFIYGEISPRDEIRNFQSRRYEIELFASKITGSGRLTSQISKFFAKLQKVLDQNSEQNEVGLEWLMNVAQIRRIKSIIQELDRQKKSAERFYSPIKEYIDSMNKFFKHSKKNVEIDAVGKIKISQNGKPIEISNLSSGEKQLFILLTHAKLGSNKRRTFIVDEPELSLHMKWQEMLVEELLNYGEHNQFIFATHSPEIVGINVKKCINVG